MTATQNEQHGRTSRKRPSAVAHSVSIEARAGVLLSARVLTAASSAKYMVCGDITAHNFQFKNKAR